MPLKIQEKDKLLESKKSNEDIITPQKKPKEIVDFREKKVCTKTLVIHMFSDWII